MSEYVSSVSKRFTIELQALIPRSTNTPTVGGSVGELSNRLSRHLEFFTEFESGIPRVVEGILKVFNEFALPYFEHYGSLPAIDHELNDNPVQGRIKGACQLTDVRQA